MAALNKASDAMSGRQKWQLSLISQHVASIENIDGELNALADLLSRPVELCETEKAIEAKMV